MNDENNVDSEKVDVNESPSGFRSKSFLGLGIALVVLIVGAFLVFGSNNKATQQTTQVMGTESSKTETQDNSQVLTVNVEGGSFYFKPNEIRVKKDQKVKIVFNNVDGFHDFVIDEFNVRTQKIQGGATAEVEFTPDKTGNFEFYCSVGSHREMGMKGNLIVE